jgi:long-subunit fatty acid transport protein
MDSLTFLFDFGIGGQLSWFNDGTNKERHLNGNLEYVGLQFPVSRRFAMSAGLLPYSFVGYNYNTSFTTDNLQYFNSYTGSGSMNEVFIGAAFDVLPKRLSIGANVGYLFGQNTYQQTLTLINSTDAASPVRTQSLRVDDIIFDLGIQYTHPLSHTKNLIAGFTFSPARRLNATSSDINTVVSGSTAQTDTLSYSRDERFDLPNSFGLGFSYNEANKLTVAADLSYQAWSSAHFFGTTDNFKNRLRIGAGIEYIPSYLGNDYLPKIRYRAGLHYNNSYIKINGHSYKEAGATIGFGFPLMDNRSIVNVAFQYVKVMPDSKTLINEQYFRFTVNYTFNERWFFKRRVN